MASGALLVQGTQHTNCQSLSGSFTLASGATLNVCSPQGLSATGPTGAVQVTSTRTFSTDARCVYTDNAAQVTGTDRRSAWPPGPR